MKGRGSARCGAVRCDDARAGRRESVRRIRYSFVCEEKKRENDGGVCGEKKVGDELGVGGGEYNK